MVENRPSIVPVLERYISLRKSGRSFVGRCPFHNDQHPSFSVSAEKGLFHCFGCGESGDVFDFVMKLEDIGFSEARACLGVASKHKPRPPITTMQLQAADLAAAWMADQRRKINVMLGDLLEKIELADEIGDSELAESFLREQSFLRDLYEDLDISRNAAALLSIRRTIEAITEGMEPLQIHFQFPPLTQEYRARLEAIAGGVS
jgi:CHC2 zinc finger